MRLAAIAVLVASVARVAVADAPPPTGKHPRIVLDGELRARWREAAHAAHGPVVGAIALCNDARTTGEHDRAVYQGSEWSSVLQACLVAWAATDDAAHARTAIRFFTALVDDLDRIGDHLGGDAAARRDDGYAIRNLGPWTALAYDWLHDVPGMTPQLRERARARWRAWLDWYRDKGYRARVPGTNYHAGFAIAATLVAIAEAGEAGADGDALWRFVADELWSKQMAGALAPTGVLDGGDWPEGWQYGPLSVAEYALAARAARAAGIDVKNVAPWLAGVLRRHVYALAPDGGVFAGGDTESETANVKPSVLTLDGIALGDASPDDRRWARGELSRLALVDRDWLFYDALAATSAGDKPQLPPRASWPTYFVTDNTGTLFARTGWDDHAVWLVVECKGAIDVDHRHPAAGNLALARGRDNAVVDPSPYGSQSTLTSNAPTVASAQLPADYVPSQGLWGQRTGFDWTTQRASGVVAARCDYSDQYRFQERKSDVPDALRDVVMFPSADGHDAVVVVVDAANTGADDRHMFLRFRTPGKLALDARADPVIATATIGATRLAIANVAHSSGTPTIGTTDAKDCFAAGTVRGRCDAARIPVTDYRLELGGPRPRAAHAISVVGAAAAPAKTSPITGTGYAGVYVGGVRDGVVVWRTPGRARDLGYSAPAGPAVVHVILGAAERTAAITARPDGDRCAVTVATGGAVPARPAVITLDAHCAVTLDPEAPMAAKIAAKPLPASAPRLPRSGCCSAGPTPNPPLVLASIVGAALVRRRRRRITAARRRPSSS